MNHKQLAKLCVESYTESDFSSGGVDVLWKETDQFHAFAIRGTQLSLIDMLRNLAWWPRSFGGIDAHAGFVNGWNEVEHWIVEASRSIKTKPIILTGHSAGGAMALIGASRFLSHYKDIPIDQCVTFGAPKAIDGKGPFTVERLSTQYIHARDPIPSWLSYTDYDHYNKIYLGGDESSSWWRKSLDCHGIDLYEELIK
jgi:Lipase (class 3)